MTVKVYVEGGGDHNKALSSQCRRGFSEFIRKAGLQDRMPRIVACGARIQAYERFRASHEDHRPDELPILLVDSEAAVNANSSREHLKLQPADQWQRPSEASDDQLHLMVQTMEAWFYADRQALQEYYGVDFRASALSKRSDIEGIPKAELLAGLRQATKDCQRGEYSKGEHSFHILERIDPAKVMSASPNHAGRFLKVLDRVCQR